ncbi:uncharacterized mitochondrial protein AtMg00810-like [Malus domestica]|uniref:uncharacterized mitochondrial protein AtMg00810-like n=1 Tax=Malus domestica TaxID=3750 RepID=UPI0010AB1618|nr:uncharacterized protein LOC108174248 [Malus domestica]
MTVGNSANDTVIHPSLVEDIVSSMHQSEDTSSSGEFETQSSSAITLSNPIGTTHLLPVLDLAQLQAPRAWNSKFTSFLLAFGFKTTLSDSSLFVKIDDRDDKGRLTYFLGLQIQYNSDGSLLVAQLKYAKELLKKTRMENCKPTSTPSKPHFQLLVAEGNPLADPTHYMSLVRALQYLTFTHPDIAHLVNVVCQYMTHPTDLHMHLVKRIMRYLQGTLECGLKYTKTHDFNIAAYFDSDWAVDINTRRSITGFVVFLGFNPVSWQSKKQATVSRSYTEAEYNALAHCAVDVYWIRSLLKDVSQFIPTPPKLHYDNLFALALYSPIQYFIL